MCITAFADLAKAFDSIDRSLLLHKLPFYGISGNVLKLIKSYLTNRKQRVNLNGMLSQEYSIDYGLPQGSILGPMFFILFINDLPRHLFKSKICIYADDTVFYYRHENIDEAIKFMQGDLDKYFKWCNYNTLTLNIDKTKAMVLDVKNKNTSNLCKLKINDRNLEYVDRIVYLGILLDRHLNFMLHYDGIMRRLNDKIYLLCKIRRYVNTYTATTIFKSYILSFLEYGSMFLEGLPISCENKLQRLQNKCLHVCHRSGRFTSNFELHTRSRVLPLRLRRKMGTCLMMYKKIKADPKIIYKPNRIGNRSGGTLIVKEPKPNRESFKKSISYIAPTTWNDLPSFIRNSNNVAEFKRRLKRYLGDIFCHDGFV